MDIRKAALRSLRLIGFNKPQRTQKQIGHYKKKVSLTMRIAVIKQSAEDSNSSYPQYLYNLLADAAKENQCQIIEWNKALKESSIPADAVVVIKSEAISKLSLKWFYEVRLPALLKKINADKVIHLDGCLSISAKQPQLLVLPGLERLLKSSKNDTEFVQYRSRKLDSFLSKASTVITGSGFTKTFVNEKGIGEDKIQNIPVSAPYNFQQVEWEEKETIKLQYADGNEFFIVHQNFKKQDELLQLLKAFSVFKKWQQSNMKLVIAGELLFDEGKSQEKISSYKYREDVKIIHGLSLNDYAKLLASAYAFIQLPGNADEHLPLLQAMQSGVAVITDSSNSTKEICGEAVLYNEDNDPQTLGNNMIRIYKNEQMRNLVIRQGSEIANSYRYEDIRQDWWKLITGSPL